MLNLAQKVYLASLARKEASFIDDLMEADQRITPAVYGGLATAGATYGAGKGLKALAKKVKPYTKVDTNALKQFFSAMSAKELKEAMKDPKLRAAFGDLFKGEAAQANGIGRKIRTAAARIGRMSKGSKAGILAGAGLAGAGATELLRQYLDK